MTVVEKIRHKDASTDSLWEAFTAAQAEFQALVKDTKGARGNYAPLNTVLDAVRPVLNRHGLALTQPTFVEGETLFVRTVLVHKSTGETHECVYPAGLLTLQHQQLGAGVTYSRRYSLLSLLGVFPENEDDDGEKAGAAGGRLTPTPPPLNSSQAKKEDVWPRFVARVRSFTDLDQLEAWWADGGTQAKIDQMPAKWQEQAAEEYEKKQEELLSAGRP